MHSFTINLEAMSRVETQHNETFRVSYEIRRRDTAPVKNNGSKTSSTFDEVDTIT